MVFGDKNIYAIEVHHQPQDEDSFYMCGRMCIYLYNKMFGDINNEYCHLYATYTTLVEKSKIITELEYDFNLENDVDIFNFLDTKLYILDEDADRTYEQIRNDIKPYLKFDFMTNEGEMFDRTKSFIYMDKNKKIHIMYQTDKYNKNNEQFESGEIICNEVDKETFENITNDFIRWYEGIENR